MKTARKKATWFEEFAADVISRSGGGVMSVVCMLEEDVIFCDQLMRDSTSIVTWRMAADKWFYGQCLLFSFRNFQ